MKEIEKFSMRAGKSRKSRSQFKSRTRYVWVKMGSPLSRRTSRHLHPLFSGVDANELYKKEKAEKDKKESA